MGAVLVTLVILALDAGTRRVVRSLPLRPETKARFLKYDVLSSLVFLVPVLGAFGLNLLAPATAAATAAYIATKAILLRSAMTTDERDRLVSSLGWLAFLFLLSGVAALIYQIVWQRVLFAAFGINIESITIVVSLFMFGLGLGSILGGLAARKYPERLVPLFVACETGIGLFGVFSLQLIRAVSDLALHGSLLVMSIAIFSLLCVPTILMGATLPILVSHLFKQYKNLGKSVGTLYFINTLGSALACFLVADVLFILLGEQASIMVAVACNWAVAGLVLQHSGARWRPTGTRTAMPGSDDSQPSPAPVVEGGRR